MDLDDVRRDWTRLGAEDPLWAVLVTPEARGGRWDVERFLQTGREEIDASLTHLRRLRPTLDPQRALDFGSGAGRLTQALAAHAATVVGVDISEPMIATARKLDVEGRCEFVLNARPDLRIFDDESFDLVYSSLVLQHMPRANAIGYLYEMARILRPGGALVVQLAARPTFSFKGLAFRWAPKPLLRWAQTRLLDYPAPMRMERFSDRQFARAIDGRFHLLDTIEDGSYGGHWHYHRHFAVKG